MGKIEAIIASIMAIKEGADELGKLFSVTISGKFYSAMDKITFLDSKALGIGSNGKIIDGTSTLGEAVCNLSNLVIWGVLLLYCFYGLFHYFLSRKFEMPMKVFIRSVVFGILVNSAFFICFSAVYFTENITQYIIEFCGGETSFCYFENAKDDLQLEVDTDSDNVNIFTAEDLIKVSNYFMTFVLGIMLGIRFILIKVLIILSPIFFALGCSTITEKWLKSGVILFLKLLSFQVVAVIVLEIFKKINFGEEAILQIMLISAMLLSVKAIKKIF